MTSAQLRSEVVPEALSRERLDRVVASLADVTRAQASELVATGRVSVNGSATARRTLKVKAGDRIDVLVDVGVEASKLEADPNVAVDVVYADDDVVVVNKAPELVVHPGSGNQEGTLVHGLLARFPELEELATGDQAIRPGIVHRLDKGTSGLLMVGRNAAAVDNLIAQLRNRTVSRHYKALAYGRFSARSGVIDAAVGRSDSDPTRMTVSASGKEAITHYRVDQAFERPDPVTLVECWLETGRTHQIRVHLSAIGHPIVGDPRYGGMRGAVVSPRPWLHAFSLTFMHPRTGQPMAFSAGVPDDLTAVLATLQ